MTDHTHSRLEISLVILGVAIFVVGIAINGYNFYRNYCAEQEQLYFAEASEEMNRYYLESSQENSDPWRNARTLIKADVAYHKAISYGADPNDKLHRYIELNLAGTKKILEQKIKGLKLTQQTKDVLGEFVDLIPQ